MSHGPSNAPGRGAARKSITATRARAPRPRRSRLPRSAFAAAAAGFDVTLSGHIHGGQFFPWNLIIGLVQPYNIGLHRVAGRMSLYVSAGTGYWGPPNRLGVPAEITSIRLERA